MEARKKKERKEGKKECRKKAREKERNLHLHAERSLDLFFAVAEGEC
jgi:hypothetical protein